jgi:hypothetical protein
MPRLLKSRWTRLAGALAAFSVAGCATQPAPAENAARPAMWRVSDPDTTIYLFGTFHLLPENFDWRTAAFEQALGSADELVMEIGDVGDQTAAAKTMMKLGISPGLPPLAERVPEAKRAALAAMVKESGVPAAVLDRLETWAAALALTGVMFKRLGLSGEAGVEKSLTASYKGKGKPISGLETTEQQLGFFDTLPEEAQRAFLVGILERPEDTRAEFDAMLNAWRSGDEAAIARTFDDEAKLSPQLRDVLLTRRNARWAEWIDGRLDRPGTVFLAVGAGHLAGRDSVQAMLEKRGIKAKRVQ